MRRYTASLLRLSSVVLMAATGATLHADSKAAVNTTRDGLAIKGVDVVAYVTAGRPVDGRPEFTYRWNDATWRFASAANRDAFARDPEAYAPQFGGYCAYAVSRGYTADVDPQAWKLVDGRLYLNYSRRVQRLWEQDVAGNIASARANWPSVLDK